MGVGSGSVDDGTKAKPRIDFLGILPSLGSHRRREPRAAGKRADYTHDTDAREKFSSIEHAATPFLWQYFYHRTGLKSRQVFSQVFSQTNTRLPQKLQAHLPDSRVAGAGHGSKKAAVEVPVRTVELGVVHDIEKFGAELEVHSLINARVLVEGNVP